jgi:hypothetical protein
MSKSITNRAPSATGWVNLTPAASNPGTSTTLWVNSLAGNLLFYGLSQVGAGDVNGPASSTNNAIVTFDGTTGKLIKNSTVRILTNDIDLSSTGAILQNSTHLLSNRNNLLIGESGSTYVGESGNILIENDGEVGDTAVIRIGDPTYHTEAFLGAYELTLRNKLALRAGYGDPTDWNAFIFADNTVVTGGNVLGIGHDCLKVHDSGWEVVAIGPYCMQSSVSCNGVTAVGAYALDASTDCTNTVAFGTSCLDGRTTGTGNTCGGYRSFLGSGLAGGTNNTTWGIDSGYQCVGSNNVYLGALQGRRTTGDRNIRIHHDMHAVANSGSDNIFIGSYGDPGDLTETATIRLGTQGTQTKAIVAGVYDQTGIASSFPVVVNSSGQLSRTTLLAQANDYTLTTVSTTPYTIVATDQYVISTVSATSSSVINLPLASAGKRIITIVDGGGNALPNVIAVTRAGGDTINGNNVYVMNVDAIACTFISNGVDTWWCVSNRN